MVKKRQEHSRQGKHGTAEDERILNLAAEVADAKDNLIPKLLLRLQDILDSFPESGKKLRNVKNSIWSYDLLEILVTSLTQDFSKIPDGWKTASKLSNILSQCCVGLDAAQTSEFREVFLSTATESLLILTRKIQMKYEKTSNVLEDTKRTLLEHMREVLDAVCNLFNQYDTLAEFTMKNPWLLQMLVTDDVHSVIVVMNVIQSANRMKRGLFGNLEEQIMHQILDELIYKLSASTNVVVAGTSMRTLIVICDSHPPVIELLCARYKGLHPLLNKWSGSDFGRDLRKVQMLLEAGNMQKVELLKYHQAATVIQAFWKGSYTRRKLKKADRAISKFHRSVRVKKEAREKKKEDARLAAELQHMLLQRRRKAMRDLRKRQLEALQILPASEVSKHLQAEQDFAAVTIQKRWRGYQVRKTIHGKERQVEQFRAVVKIQREVRKWLEIVRRKKKEPPSWQRPPGLTDERRVELQGRIMEWRESHSIKVETEEQRKELHDQVQAMLRRNAMQSKMTRKSEQHRAALLGRLEIDSKLLSSAPTLTEVTEGDLENFVSHSVPIATKARNNHIEELRLLRQPWWRKLGDEYQDLKSAEESEDWRLF